MVVIIKGNVSITGIYEGKKINYIDLMAYDFFENYEYF